MGYIKLKWFRNVAFRFLSRWWKVRNSKIKAWKAKLMKSCFSGMKNKPKPRTRRAGTRVPRADTSRTVHKSSSPGSPHKTPTCILTGRRGTHCWSRHVLRHGLTESSSVGQQWTWPSGLALSFFCFSSKATDLNPLLGRRKTLRLIPRVKKDTEFKDEIQKSWTMDTRFAVQAW